LDESFVNAWALATDVQAMAENADLPESVRQLAADLAERHRYPVDSQVIGPDGSVLGQIVANDQFTDPNWSYRRFLMEALERASAH